MTIDESMWADVVMGERDEEEELMAGFIKALSLEDIATTAAAAATGEHHGFDPMDIDEPDHVGDHIDRLMKAATVQLGDHVGRAFASYVAYLNSRIARLEDEVTRLGALAEEARLARRPFFRKTPNSRFAAAAALGRPKTRAGRQLAASKAVVRTKAKAAGKAEAPPKAVCLYQAKPVAVAKKTTAKRTTSRQGKNNAPRQLQATPVRFQGNLIVSSTPVTQKL